MSERRQKEDAERLAERLRREDLDARPEFSQSLDERVCQAIRECEAPQARTPRRWSPSRAAWRWAAAALTAASLAAVLVWAWKAGSSRQPPDATGSGQMATPLPAPTPSPAAVPRQVAADFSPAVELPREVSASIPALIDSVAALPQWAYLDHDARLTLRMLADRLPLEMAASSRSAGGPETP